MQIIQQGLCSQTACKQIIELAISGTFTDKESEFALDYAGEVGSMSTFIRNYFYKIATEQKKVKIIYYSIFNNINCRKMFDISVLRM